MWVILTGCAAASIWGDRKGDASRGKRGAGPLGGGLSERRRAVHRFRRQDAGRPLRAHAAHPPQAGAACACRLDRRLLLPCLQAEAHRLGGDSLRLTPGRNRMWGDQGDVIAGVVHAHHQYQIPLDVAARAARGDRAVHRRSVSTLPPTSAPVPGRHHARGQSPAPGPPPAAY